MRRFKKKIKKKQNSKQFSQKTALKYKKKLLSLNSLIYSLKYHSHIRHDQLDKFLLHKRNDEPVPQIAIVRFIALRRHLQRHRSHERLLGRSLRPDLGRLVLGAVVQQRQRLPDRLHLFREQNTRPATIETAQSQEKLVQGS